MNPQIFRLVLRWFTPQLLVSLCLCLAYVHPVHADELEYQKRGGYWEGTRAKPVSSGFGLELISALADYQDQPDRVGDEFHARFFLKEAGKICLVARERDNRRYYWLDRVSPKPSWRPGFGNEFTWTTRPVIKSLGLKLYDLGVVARLGCDRPGAEERVAPVVLYQARAPKAVDGYVFTFKRSEGMNLTARVYLGDSDASVYEQPLGNQFGPGIFDLVWPARDRTTGDYRLTLDGYRTSDNDRVYQEVRFYHQPRIE